MAPLVQIPRASRIIGVGLTSRLLVPPLSDETLPPRRYPYRYAARDIWIETSSQLQHIPQSQERFVPFYVPSIAPHHPSADHYPKNSITAGGNEQENGEVLLEAPASQHSTPPPYTHTTLLATLPIGYFPVCFDINSLGDQSYLNCDFLGCRSRLRRTLIRILPNLVVYLKSVGTPVFFFWSFWNENLDLAEVTDALRAGGHDDG